MTRPVRTTSVKPPWGAGRLGSTGIKVVSTRLSSSTTTSTGAEGGPPMVAKLARSKT